jgi:hypothetical protein
MPGRRTKAARPKPAARKTGAVPAAPAAMRCDLCGEASGTARRHASASECFVALRQAVDASREDLTLARREGAIVAHRAETLHGALREIADLLRPDLPPKALPGVVARVRALAVQHAGTRS